MGKYIIDIVDTTDRLICVGVEDGSTYTYTALVEGLMPYTEPDMEQVRKEAYDKGYEDGREYCPGQLSCMDATYQKGFMDGTKQCANCEDFKESAKAKAYQQGLSDAWEAARKIALTEGLDINGMYTVFGTENPEPIFREYSASECIEKIRQYEQEKEEIIDPDKNKVEALANDIGIHKLYALVKEIRGE